MREANSEAARFETFGASKLEKGREKDYRKFLKKLGFGSRLSCLVLFDFAELTCVNWKATWTTSKSRRS